MSDGTVHPDSLVTLNYRLVTGDDIELVSTFGATPATLQLGSGELAPPLEACLDGLTVGERRVFTLAPEQAFGLHKPQLVRRVPQQELAQSGAVALHTLVEFAAPNGAKFSGLVRELDADSAMVDFNHPLAGKSLSFEVEIVGIL